MIASLPKIVFLSVWVIALFALINRKNIRLLKKLARYFNGSLASYSLIIPALAGLYEGLKFYIHITPKFLEVRGTLRIRLYVRSLVAFRAHRRSLVVRAAAKTGLFHQVTTGDPVFDEEFLIFARQAEIAKSYLLDAGRRQVLRQIFDLGMSMLVTDDKGAWTEKYDYDRKTDLELEHITAVLDILKALSTGT